MGFQAVGEEHLAYLGAAYAQGALASLGEAFRGGDLERDEFHKLIAGELEHHYHGAWVLFAEAERGYIPVGLVLGFFVHHFNDFSEAMIIHRILRFPWASPRNIIEATVNFFAFSRDEIPMMIPATEDEKKFVEVLARHGIVRRVGTSFNLTGEQVALFETRVA